MVEGGAGRISVRSGLTNLPNSFHLAVTLQQLPLSPPPPIFGALHLMQPQHQVCKKIPSSHVPRWRLAAGSVQSAVNDVKS